MSNALPVNLDWRIVGALLLTLTTWASAFAAIRLGLREFSPGHLALLRFATASLVLGLCALWRPVRLPQREDWSRIAASGFLAITVYHVALNFGEVSVSAGAASFLINTAPIWTALLSMRFLGERLPIIGWIGITLSMIGVLIIASGEGKSDQTLQSKLLNPAALLIVLAAIAASFSMTLNKPLLRRYSALELTSYSVWLGTIPLLIFLPDLGREVRSASSAALWSSVYLGVFPAALAYVTWAYVLSRLSASRTASFLYLVPALATFIAWLWLGEKPASSSLGGGALALCGVVLVNVFRSRRQSTLAAPVAVK